MNRIDELLLKPSKVYVTLHKAAVCSGTVTLGFRIYGKLFNAGKDRLVPIAPVRVLPL